MTDPLPEWRVREIARQAADETVKLLCERLGIEDIAEARGDLDHLRRIVKSAEARASEGRKTVFTIIGGVVLAVLGYLAAAFNMKGHVP